MEIVVVGMGYVGLTTALCLAEIEHNVKCIDIDEKKIEMLKNGKVPIYEPNLEKLMLKNKDKITYTTNVKKTYKDSDVIFIAVETPSQKDGSVNITYVSNVALEIAHNIERNCTIVIKSTVPVGTCEKIEKLIRDNLKYEVNVEVVSNPEFLSQGSAI